jgi:leucyl/phenylalanyl-tRNA--protein transferase
VTEPGELPPSSWSFPPIEALTDEDDLIAIGADLEPSTIIDAYRTGYFPMPVGRRRTGWFSPDPRGVLLPGRLRISRSLRRSIKRFRYTTDRAFDEVLLACGDPSRPHGWIDHDIRRAYTTLHHLGFVHSVEAWDDDGLAGGLYGVQIGGLFAGESMFHRRADASKAALVHLVDLQGARVDSVIDVQWETPHLTSLGVEAMSRSEYGRRLPAALALDSPTWP